MRNPVTSQTFVGLLHTLLSSSSSDVNPRVNPATGRRSEIISGSLLTAWSQHEFRVIAKNGYGSSSPSSSSPIFSTKEERPMKYPGNVGGGGGNTGDLTITWNVMMFCVQVYVSWVHLSKLPVFCFFAATIFLIAFTTSRLECSWHMVPCFL